MHSSNRKVTDSTYLKYTFSQRSNEEQEAGVTNLSIISIHNTKAYCLKR